MMLSLPALTRFSLWALSLFMLLGAGLMAQAQSNAIPAIRYVRTDGTNPNPATATSWATSTTNLQGAINASAVGDQVWVAAGTYKPGGNANTDRTISFAMKNGVSILGGFAATGDPTLTARNPTSFTTVLSGDIGTVGGNTDNSYHVVSNPQGLNASAVLDGVVIRNGNADGSGGDKDSGGGMLNARSSPTLISCSFVSNSASLNGGGLCNNGDSTPTLTNCSFQGNRGAYGGGMCNYFPGSSPTLTNCSFVSNSADFNGGGVCSIYYNTTTLINCSFVSNSTRNNGAGVANRNGSNSRLVNCALFGNGGANALYKEADCEITVTYSLLQTGVTNFTNGVNNLTTAVSPFLSPTDARLNACALAIDAGNNEVNTTTTDLARNPRRYKEGRIDMGAYEYQAAPGITLTAPGMSTATVGVAFSQSFTASGGTSPYSYSLASGTLPPGLNLATTGVLSGTPTQAASFTLTAKASEATSCSGVSAPYVLTVSEPPSPIRYVRADGSGSGNSWTDASGDLQSQINFPGAQQVWVAQGTYKPNPSSSFAMKNGVAIYGGFADTETPPTSLTERNPDSFTTVLSGDNKGQVFVNSGGLTATAVLDGVTITRGYVVYGWGGGMHNANGSSPTLANCIFLNNSASYGGGGMYNNGSSPTLTNCLFLGNNGRGQGGGIHNTRSNPTLTNCRFMTNSANGGGGIYNTQESMPILTSCLFQNNSADGLGGGGVANFEGGNPQLINCSFINNSATRGGGGITHFYGRSSLINCLFRGNTASEGGAVYNYGNSNYVRLFNCTLVNNSASSGGGTYTNGYNVNTILISCVVFGNGGTNTFVSASEDPYGGTKISYSLLETGSIDFIDEGNNLMTTVSPFVSSTDARLNACSPAINTGSNGNNNSTNDLAGGPRRYNGGIIDMGAYEFQGQPNFPTGITQQPPNGSLVCPGSTVSIPLSVRGTGAFTYQLVDATGTPVGPSQSTTPLTLANVQPAQSGSYSVIVTGSCNSVTSTAFSLTVPNPATPTLLTQTGQSYSGGQSKVTVDLNSGNVNLVVGGCNGTIAWSGPNNSSGSTSPINVPTSAPGTFIYTASCTVNGCTSPAASATVTVQGRLTVLHRDVDNYATNNAIQPLLQLQNQGTGALPLSAITLRYYVTVEGSSALSNLSVNYAQVGNQNVRLRYVPLQPAQQGAAGYVEVSFTQGAGSLAAGANSGPIQAYFAKGDYGTLNETDDYSYNPVRDQLTASLRITAYYNGVLIAGLEPGSTTQIRSIRALTESKNGPSATQISTYLEVRNEGNVPVNYSDLSARYYFTSDGTERLQVEVDEGQVRTQLVALAQPVAGANYYLEIRYSQAGQLAPGASTGTVRYRISKPQGGRFDQSNDHSYQEQPQDRSQNSRVVVLVGSERVWGTPPAGAGSARLAASQESGTELQVRVLGNPVTDDQIRIEIVGAQDQSLRLQLTDLRGRVVSERLIDRAGAVERQQLPIGQQPAGVLLLQVSTPAQSQTLKVLKR